MLNNCAKLEKLNVTNFDTSKSEDMSYMFSKCISLSELDEFNVCFLYWNSLFGFI